ncbi:MAG: ParB N-terminal domain-containing protein [Patescibacteria group bacterium]|nr:ParB N-terminal domain-containing protein [Patescibacteria group bacterium]
MKNKRESTKTAGLRMLPIAQMIVLRRNPQYLTPHEMKALVASIKRDGFLVPVLVRPKPGKKYEVLSGNHRIMAAREAGLTDVPAVIVNMDDKAAARVAINLNTVHGDPPAELLAPWLAELDKDTLATIHLDDALRKAIVELDESMMQVLAIGGTPKEWDAESVKTEVAGCVCPKCGKRHIRGTTDRAR